MGASVADAVVARRITQLPRSYTGSRDAICHPSWFEDIFGFEEDGYEKTKRQFDFARGILFCRVNQKVFTVGPFGTPTLGELQEGFTEATLNAHAGYWSLGGLSFRNIVADTLALHRDASNAGAVFQVSSLINCLGTGYGFTPEHGVTRYAADPSQSSACAIACAAGTVFRNYFVNGSGQTELQQLDCLGRIGGLVDNAKKSFWTVRNGLCLPRVRGGIARLSKRIANDHELRDTSRLEVQVGVHWDTEVCGAAHNVCQVFCPALPVGCEKSVKAADWLPFATLVLEAAFDATLTVAATLAVHRGQRIKVFLTALGGGWLGNRQDWIAAAADRAMKLHEKQPLDVALVHYAQLPAHGSAFANLELGRDAQHEPSVGADAQSCDLGVTHYLRGRGLDRPSDDDRGVMTSLFKRFDVNGDGVLDCNEFRSLLQAIDPDFFIGRIVDLLIKEADAGGDGVVHYEEFVGWLCGEDEALSRAVLTGSPMPACG